MDNEILSALDERWNNLANTIRTLRADKAACQETVRERDDRVAELELELESLRSQVQTLQGERNDTLRRIEGLISRIDGMEL